MKLRLVACIATSSLVAALTNVGCRPSPTIIDGIRPEDRTARETLGEAECRAVGERDQPLVVDWTSHDRIDLQLAMREGVAVVHYECGKLRLLPNCKAEGSYRFVGTSKQEQIVQLNDATELAANLPVGGALLAKELSGSLSLQSSIDLAMVLVGKTRTTVTQAAHEKLSGGAACEGATHFVRGGYVGAFAMGTGTRGAGKTVAMVVKAQGESSKLAKYRDGDTTKCDGVVPGGEEPPSGCAALVRLELVALSGHAPKVEKNLPGASATCPTGLVLTNGKCAKATSAKAYQCKDDDPIECFEQCDKGYASSCASLGVAHATGKSVPRDDAKAAKYFKSACDGRDLGGCVGLGVLLSSGRGVPKDTARAFALQKLACDGGEASGCLNLGVAHAEGEGVSQNWATANTLFKNACNGGLAAGCYSLGVMAYNGRGMESDALRASALFKRACDGSYASACNNLAAMYAEGTGLAKDEARAAALYEKACDAEDAAACNNLGWMYEGGHSLPKDLARATALQIKSCEISEKHAGERGEDADGCFHFAELVAGGRARPGPFPEPVQLYKRACMAGSGKACNALKYSYGVTPPREP